MGVLSEFLQPIIGKMQVNQWAQPAIFSNAEVAIVTMTGLLGKKVSVKQAIIDYSRDTVGIVGAVVKMEERTFNEYNKTNIRLKKAYRNYIEEFGEEAEASDSYMLTT